jgi:hypothetical protein
MAYKPQPGMRKHKQLIGDALAEVEWSIEEMETLTKAAKNVQTQLHIARTVNRLRSVQVALYAMLSIIQDGNASEE